MRIQHKSRISDHFQNVGHVGYLTLKLRNGGHQCFGVIFQRFEGITVGECGGDFRGNDVMDAMEGHILDQAEIVGTYTTNPSVA